MNSANTTVAMGSAIAKAVKCSRLPPVDHPHADVPAMLNLALHASGVVVGSWGKAVVQAFVTRNGVDVWRWFRGAASEQQSEKQIAHMGLSGGA